VMAEGPASPDLLQRQRRAVEAGGRRDWDAAMTFYAPDAVWDASRAGGVTFEGAAAIRSFFEDWVGAYEEYGHEIVESRDLGNGIVFTLLVIDGRLAGGTSRVQETWSWTATWVEGMCERVVADTDIDQARAAAERLAQERGSTMSEESTTPDLVELTRLAFKAANQRDIDAVMSFFAPDAVHEGRVGGDLYKDRAEIRGAFDDWFSSFAELRFEVEEFVVLDDGVVLAVVNQKGRPVGVDGQVHQREGWVICWSADGLIMRLTTHADIDEARAAAERLAKERG
jgi:ketosteroid isomerase-like protein